MLSIFQGTSEGVQGSFQAGIQAEAKVPLQEIGR